MHYVIGDVHGCYDEMIALINKIESEDSEAEFIFVGDFVDRGPQVDKVLDWCLANITKNGKYRSVRGNHEQMILEWYELWLSWWKKFRHYPQVTMPESDYDFSKWMDALDKLTPDKMEPYMKFFDSLPYNIKMNITTSSGVEQEYIIVHASYSFNEVMMEQQEHTNLWSRNYGGNKVNDTVIIHGHTPTLTNEYIFQTNDCNHPGMICYSKNDINVDGGCVFSKRFKNFPAYLCAICLENLQEKYAYTLEDRFRMKHEEKAMAEIYLHKYMEDYGSSESMYRKELLEKLIGK